MPIRAAADLGAWLTRYVEDLRVRHYAASSLKQVQIDGARLVQYLYARGVKRPRGVTEAHLAAYARALARWTTRRGERLAPASRTIALSVARRFFAFLARREVVLWNPAHVLAIPKIRSLPRGVLTIAQAHRLVATPNLYDPIGVRDRAILETLYGTGLRLGEVVRADLTDLDLRNRVLLVRTGKGRKDRIVPIGAAAVTALDHYLTDTRPRLANAGEPALFVNRNGRRLQAPGLRVRVHNAGHRIGVTLHPTRAAPRVRDASAARRCRPAPRASAPRPSLAHHHRDLHARRDHGSAIGDPELSSARTGASASSETVKSIVLATHITTPMSTWWRPVSMPEPDVCAPIDPNGNLAADGLTSYTWNARNQLVGMSGVTSASFAYDALGRRQSKTISGTATNFLYDKLNLVQELSNGTPSANLLSGSLIDETLTRSDSNGSTTLLTDAQRSTIGLADASGAVQTSYTFEPFGQTQVSGSPSANATEFASRENDGVGLYYYRSRFYSPALQRFLSEDPKGFAGGDVNLFAYVSNSPVTFVDPLGLDQTIWDFGGNGRYGPRNGNWGGSDWSGGQVPGRNGGRDGTLPPTDSADRCYMEHDRCYERCSDHRRCDEQLLRCLHNLPWDPRNWPEPPRPGTLLDTLRFMTYAEGYFGTLVNGYMMPW